MKFLIRWKIMERALAWILVLNLKIESETGDWHSRDWKESFLLLREKPEIQESLVSS